MTKDEISKIKEHIEIHARREPRAIKITEIMREAVVELERIADLEKENTKLKERNAELKGMYAHSAREAGTYKQFFELKEKENAELKERADKADLDSVLFFNRLCKAEEIIKLLLWDLRNRNYEPVKDIERAEQFIKEQPHEATH